MNGIALPPLFHGVATVDAPRAVAVDMARAGCDAGTIVHNLSGADLRAALILAPEVPLAQAMAMLPTCGIGLQNALGALAPPEVCVHLRWDGAIMVNGAHCGALTAVAPPCAGGERPGWLIIGLTLALWSDHAVPGETPDVTTLHDEGCGEIAADALLAAWARHTLVWINTWAETGPRSIHEAFTGIWHKDEGDFGLDPDLGRLRKSDGTTTLAPLTDLLEPA